MKSMEGIDFFVFETIPCLEEVRAIFSLLQVGSYRLYMTLATNASTSIQQVGAPRQANLCAGLCSSEVLCTSLLSCFTHITQVVLIGCTP